MVQEEVFASIAGSAQMMGLLFSSDPVKNPVSAGLFETLSVMDASEVAAEWPCLNSDEAGELLKRLQDSLSSLDELAVEYRHLFVGPNKLAAPPYGSVYTDYEQVVFGETTLALRSWMRKEGVGVDGLDGAPEDHIGTMLLLLSWLVEHRPDLVETYLAEHLLTWAPHYLEELCEAAQQGFYGALGQLALRTLVGLKGELSLDVVEPRFYR